VALNPNATIGKNDQCMNILHAMGTVSALSRYMERIPHRRRAIVLFGSGINVPPDCDDRIMRSTAEEANRASVTVYSVDVRGLAEAGTPLTIQSYGSDPDKPGWASALRDEVSNEKDTLRYLSNATGGFAAVNLNDLAPAFTRIMRENSSYYLLGFSPSSQRRDGKFHELEVKVARPDVEVKARTGYVAAKGTADVEAAGSRTSAALGQALADPFPVSDIPIRVSVAAFRGEKAKAALSLTIELDASRFAFREANGLHTDGLEVALYSARRGKAVVDTHELLQLSLGGNYASVRADGLRVGQRIEVPAGHHRLLVGLRETNGGLIGTLPFELDVPDFAKSTPSLSSIVLASAVAARVQTTHADLSLKNVLPSPPTARRAFTRDDRLAVFAELYGSPAQLAGVLISATIDREDGSRAVDVEATARDGRASAGVPYTGRADLRAVAPGRYALTVRAARPGNQPIVRSTPFEVR
jgi:hypothetical protein